YASALTRSNRSSRIAFAHRQYAGPGVRVRDSRGMALVLVDVALITYFAGRVYDPNEVDRGRMGFAGEYLRGDASLMISDLTLTDSGDYNCKVKNVKPSKPRCWMEGKLLEGADVKMSCKSSDGSDPVLYKWERLLDKGRYAGKMPPLALLDVRGMGVVAGAVVGVSFGVLLIILIVWLVCRKKEMKKYEEEETPNEIREDAEAPKAKLVNPNSLSSSRSGSSRSGTSSTQSMVHGAPPPQPAQPQQQQQPPRGQRPCVPAVAALREGKAGQPGLQLQPQIQPGPPAYTLPPPGHARTPEPRAAVPVLTPPPSSSSCATSAPSSRTPHPHPHPHPHPRPHPHPKPVDSPKISPANLARMGATPSCFRKEE
ncbi:hypothetical protein CRUP_010860, partial [Coryphaenoides rupestris]